MTRATNALIAALSALIAFPAAAAPIFAEGDYPTLDTNMKRHGRQFYTLNARPFGLSLDGHYPDEAARGSIEQFLGQDASDDFEAVTGSHPYQVLSDYGEFADLGQFGGVGMAAAAFEYLTLKRDGADGVGIATNLAIVNGAVMCIVANLFLSWLMYG